MNKAQREYVEKLRKTLRIAFNTESDTICKTIDAAREALSLPIPADDPGYVMAPVEPTYEMIRAACIAQCSEKYDSYEDWWNSHTSGISERIRGLLVKDYKAMIAARPKG